MPYYEYTEENTHIDWIDRDEIHATLQARYIKAEYLYAYGTAQQIADFMGYHVGLHTRDSQLGMLEKRLSSIQRRLTQFTQKRKHHANLRSTESA